MYYWTRHLKEYREIKAGHPNCHIVSEPYKDGQHYWLIFLEGWALGDVTRIPRPSEYQL